jgi:hypothetical protein
MLGPLTTLTTTFRYAESRTILSTTIRDAGLEQETSPGVVAPSPHPNPDTHALCTVSLYLSRLAQPLLGSVVATHLGAAQDGSAPG